MAKVIIGVHGLENKPAKDILTAWWKQSMEEGLTGIGKNYPLPAFELIYWADIVYDKPLSADITDKDDPCYLDDVYTPAPTNFLAKTSNLKHKLFVYANKQLRKIFLSSDFSLKHKKIADTLVERFFHDLDIYYEEPGSEEYASHNPMKTKIVERIVNALKKYKNDDIFLIGHSMGSILCYDATRFEVPEINIHTLVTIGSPLGLPLVLAKIAARQGKNGNETPVLQTPASICNQWYNFSDPEDVIALNPRLAQEFKENLKGVKPTDVTVSNNYVLNEKRNPHKSYGYLRTKEFAKVLAAFIEEKHTLMWRIRKALKLFIEQAKNVWRKKIIRYSLKPQLLKFKLR